MKTNINITKSHMFVLGILYAAAMAGMSQVFIKEARAYFRDVLSLSVVEKTIEKTIEKEVITDDWAYIANELSRANLNPPEAFTVIWGESRGDRNAYNINTNKTADIGIWQINTIHIKSGSITLECAAEIRCATKWAIEKRLKDGSWGAWYAAKAMGIK